ncbi:MAG: class I SAM-dependent methyltransferase [Acidimicrobiales bacterium]
MGEQTNTRRSYDAVASRYAAEISDELDNKPLDRALLAALSELTAGGPVLDVGCGPGHVSAHLSAHGTVVFCLDLSLSMCVLGRQITDLAFVTADMTFLPVSDRSVTGIVCLYSVIHLDPRQRDEAYAEFTRVLCPGGHALVGFHVSDDEVQAGGEKSLVTWWGQEVELTFRFLAPAEEISALKRAGLDLVAHLDRVPQRGAEHPSRRSYLLVRRP